MKAVTLASDRAAPTRPWVRMSPAGAARSALTHLVLVAGMAVVVLPFVWMLTSAFQTMQQLQSFPPQWIPRPLVLDNFVAAWQAIPLGRFYLNSAVVSVTVVAFQFVIAALAAYLFARLEFPGRDVIFMLFLGTMMLPSQVILIPRFLIVKALGWIDTYPALIVPFLASPFATFLLRQSFLSLPRDLEDAARMDGCSRLQILFQIVLPLCKPAIAAMSIFTFMDQWNQFLWPLVVMQTEERYTLQVGLAMLRSELSTDWPTLMAASVLAVVPMILVYFFAQRQFIEGITMTGLQS